MQTEPYTATVAVSYAEGSAAIWWLLWEAPRTNRAPGGARGQKGRRISPHTGAPVPGVCKSFCGFLFQWGTLRGDTQFSEVKGRAGSWTGQGHHTAPFTSPCLADVTCPGQGLGATDGHRFLETHSYSHCPVAPRGGFFSPNSGVARDPFASSQPPAPLPDDPQGSSGTPTP